MKKVIILFLTIVLTLQLCACGQQASKSEIGTDEIPVNDENSSEEEQIVTEQIGDNQTDVESEIPQVDSEEIEEEIIDDAENPTWCLDSEGIHSDLLGISIKNSNEEIEEMCLMANFFIGTSNGKVRSYEQYVFRCISYDGDVDKWIFQHDYDGIMEKGTLAGVEYAYSPNGVAFVGNGVAIYSEWHTEMSDNSVPEFLERINIVTAYEEELNKDCLAYLCDNGIYCPALGIKLSCVGTDHRRNGYFASCRWKNYEASIQFSDETINDDGAMMYYMVDANSAQEVVDQYVSINLEPSEYRTIEYTEIEGTEQKQIGRNEFLGRGCLGKYEWSDETEQYWLFFSDASNWSISLEFPENETYEKYISVIESY